MYFTADDLSVLCLSLPSPEVFWRKEAYFTGGTLVEFIFMNSDNKHPVSWKKQISQDEVLSIWLLR